MRLSLIEVLIIVVIVAMIGAIVASHYGRDNDCKRFQEMARTHADSMQVFEVCHLRPSTQYVPVPSGH